MKKVIVSLSLLLSVSLYGQQTNTSNPPVVAVEDTSKFVYEHAEYVKQELNAVSQQSLEYQKWFKENFTYPNNCKIPSTPRQDFVPKN